MNKVGEIFYTSVLRVTDGDGLPVSTLVDGDFTKTVYKNGVVVVAPALTIYHLGSGNYQGQLTPDAVGIWTIVITQITYAPDGWAENVNVYAADAELEYTGALCTLAEIHDDLVIPDTDTEIDTLIARLISSVSSKIIAYCQTQFVAKSILNEYHDIDENQSKLFLDYYPIYTVSAVTEDDQLLTYNADPDETEYHIYKGYIEKAFGPFSPGQLRCVSERALRSKRSRYPNGVNYER
jgi:hypothetical protein